MNHKTPIMTLLAFLAALLGLLAWRERHARQAALARLADAETRAETAYGQGHAEGLTAGYERGRRERRGALERARLHGYDEALADVQDGIVVPALATNQCATRIT